MRWAVTILGVTACGFAPSASQQPSDDGGMHDGAVAVDATEPTKDGTTTDLTCGWTFAHTNFDGCMLAPNPAPLTVTADMSIDANATAPNRTTVAQSDGTTIVVFHLSSLAIDPTATLTITDAPGVAGVVFAVDDDVSVAGSIAASAGANEPTHCATSKGTDGADSTANAAGGGGGGGGGAADVGGDGTNGAIAGFGAKGVHGAAIANAASLSPLRGGCAGGRGGKIQGGGGTGTQAGPSGGAIQLAARGTIIISGEIDAAGRGGGTSAHAGEGGGGGGAGGGILIEAPTVTISGRVCADGGSGAEGGGANPNVGGSPGQTSPCTGTATATTTDSASAGGTGGDGGYAGSHAGASAGPAATSNGFGGGGGGGGGAVGWIRIHATTHTVGGAVSPQPLVN